MSENKRLDDDLTTEDLAMTPEDADGVTGGSASSLKASLTPSTMFTFKAEPTNVRGPNSGSLQKAAPTTKDNMPRPTMDHYTTRDQPGSEGSGGGLQKQMPDIGPAGKS